MRDIMRLLFIPIVGSLAIGLIFLSTLLGGGWDIVYEEGLRGNAIQELNAIDGVIGPGRCDPRVFQPVCGLDGETYDNTCLAVQAGTEPAHHGACGARG